MTRMAITGPSGRIPEVADALHHDFLGSLLFMHTPELTIYYDGNCPICRREIALYRRLRGANRLLWMDASVGISLGVGISCETAMRRFHVRDAQGRLFSGGAAFARLWRSLPAWRVLGWLFRWPPLSWLLEGAYRVFLHLRPLVQRIIPGHWHRP